MLGHLPEATKTTASATLRDRLLYWTTAKCYTVLRTDLAAARFEKGLDSYFEVLTATLDLFNARQSLIRLRLAREINSVNLYKALGGGW